MADETVKPPRGFYKRGKYWSIYKVINGARLRVSTHQTTLDNALAWWELRKGRVPSLLFPKLTREIRSEALTLYNSAKSRSLKNGDEFAITVEDVIVLFVRSGNKCEVTKTPFSSERIGLCRRGPYRPSLDRIKADAGYTSDNIRLVCVAVNNALGEWGDKVFFRLAESYVSHKITPQQKLPDCVTV